MESEAQTAGAGLVRAGHYELRIMHHASKKAPTCLEKSLRAIPAVYIYHNQKGI